MAKKKRPALVDLGRRLKTLRGEMSAEKLAAKIGVTDGAIRMWESGARDPGTEGLLKLSRALKVSPIAFLVDETPDENKSEAPTVDEAIEHLRAFSRAPLHQRNLARDMLLHVEEDIDDTDREGSQPAKEATES